MFEKIFNVLPVETSFRAGREDVTGLEKTQGKPKVTVWCGRLKVFVWLVPPPHFARLVSNFLDRWVNSLVGLLKTKRRTLEQLGTDMNVIVSILKVVGGFYRRSLEDTDG